MTEPAPNADVGYAEALAELETILAELEDDHVDVDLLAAKVRRAAALIELCRARIESARVEVTRIVAPAHDEA
ncbi:MAG: exodeoxyribonuclease VII small subunit [Acidimicrobiales bacterium]